MLAAVGSERVLVLRTPGPWPADVRSCWLIKRKLNEAVACDVWDIGLVSHLHLFF
jgi:hypothetical protein